MLNQRRQYQSRELEQLDKIYNELSVLYTNIGSLLETGAIPLSGTVDGSPVTGDIQVYDGFAIKTRDYDDLGNNQIQAFGDVVRVGHASDNSLADGFIGVSVIGGIYAGSVDMPTGSVGLRGVSDYTANITDLDYTQKKYVDTHIAFTTVPSSSSDIGVKGSMAVDATYLYVCVATDTWTRIALTW